MKAKFCISEISFILQTRIEHINYRRAWEWLVQEVVYNHGVGAGGIVAVVAAPVLWLVVGLIAASVVPGIVSACQSAAVVELSTVTTDTLYY